MNELEPEVDYIPEIATVTAIQPLTAAEKLFHVVIPHRALGHSPGQFVQVSLPGIGEAPISVASAPGRGEGFDLCIRRAGNVTDAIHRLQPGDKIGIRGPFGRGVPLDECMGRDVLIICGGLGLAPMRSLIQYISDARDRFKKTTVLIGSRTPSTLLFRDEFDSWRAAHIGVQVTVDTAREDWTGDVGVITNLIPQIELWPETTVSIVCGPPIMYRFVLRKLAQRQLASDHIFISLERRMKCGMGKCGHCQMNGLYVCREGPVFRMDQLASVPESVR